MLRHDAHSLSIETMTSALALAKPRLGKANCKLIEPLEILQNNHIEQLYLLLYRI